MNIVNVLIRYAGRLSSALSRSMKQAGRRSREKGLWGARPLSTKKYLAPWWTQRR